MAKHQVLVAPRGAQLLGRLFQALNPWLYPMWRARQWLRERRQGAVTKQAGVAAGS